MFQTDRLIIIAGPSCAGKSTLIKKIKQGDCPRLCEQLGIAIPSSWLYVNAVELAHIRQPFIKRLIVHYDIYDQYSQENGFNNLHELISNSDSVMILTLCVPPPILVLRFLRRIGYKNRFKFLLYNLGVYRPKIKKRRLRLLIRAKKLKMFKNGFTVFVYEEWFNYFKECSVTNHYLLDFNKPNAMVAHPYKKKREQGSTLRLTVAGYPKVIL